MIKSIMMHFFKTKKNKLLEPFSKAHIYASKKIFENELEDESENGGVCTFLLNAKEMKTKLHFRSGSSMIEFAIMNSSHSGSALKEGPRKNFGQLDLDNHSERNFKNK